MKEALKKIQENIPNRPENIVEFKNLNKHVPELETAMKSLLALGFGGTEIGEIKGEIGGQKASLVFNQISDFPYLLSVGQELVSYTFTKHGHGMNIGKQNQRLNATELLFAVYATIDLLEQKGF